MGYRPVALQTGTEKAPESVLVWKAHLCANEGGAENTLRGETAGIFPVADMARITLSRGRMTSLTCSSYVSYCKLDLHDLNQWEQE